MKTEIEQLKKGDKYKLQKLLANELMRLAKVPNREQGNNVLEDLNALANFLQIRITVYDQHTKNKLSSAGPLKELILEDEIPAAVISLKIYLLLDQDKFANNGAEKPVSERRAHFNYLKILTSV